MRRLHRARVRDADRGDPGALVDAENKKRAALMPATPTAPLCKHRRCPRRRWNRQAGKPEIRRASRLWRWSPAVLPRQPGERICSGSTGSSRIALIRRLPPELLSGAGDPRRTASRHRGARHRRAGRSVSPLSSHRCAQGADPPIGPASWLWRDGSMGARSAVVMSLVLALGVPAARASSEPDTANTIGLSARRVVRAPGRRDLYLRPPRWRGVRWQRFRGR